MRVGHGLADLHFWRGGALFGEGCFRMFQCGSDELWDCSLEDTQKLGTGSRSCV